jgi:hypothetical protein
MAVNNQKIEMVESAVEVLTILVDDVFIKVDTLTSRIEVIDSKLDLFEDILQENESKICAIESLVQNIEMNIGEIYDSSCSVLSKIDTYEENFQYTWTIIEADIQKLYSNCSLVDVIIT